MGAPNPAGVGHNSVAREEGDLLLDRVERLEDEIKALQDDKKDVWAEAKSRGFDVKALKEVARRRKAKKANPQAYAETQAVLDTYLVAFGVEE